MLGMGMTNFNYNVDIQQWRYGWVHRISWSIRVEVCVLMATEEEFVQHAIPNHIAVDEKEKKYVYMQ